MKEALHELAKMLGNLSASQGTNPLITSVHQFVRGGHIRSIDGYTTFCEQMHAELNAPAFQGSEYSELKKVVLTNLQHAQLLMRLKTSLDEYTANHTLSKENCALFSFAAHIASELPSVADCRTLHTLLEQDLSGSTGEALPQIRGTLYQLIQEQGSSQASSTPGTATTFADASRNKLTQLHKALAKTRDTLQRSQDAQLIQHYSDNPGTTNSTLKNAIAQGIPTFVGKAISERLAPSPDAITGGQLQPGNYVVPKPLAQDVLEQYSQAAQILAATQSDTHSVQALPWCQVTNLYKIMRLHKHFHELSGLSNDREIAHALMIASGDTTVNFDRQRDSFIESTRTNQVITDFFSPDESQASVTPKYYRLLDEQAGLLGAFDQALNAFQSTLDKGVLSQNDLTSALSDLFKIYQVLQAAILSLPQGGTTAEAATYKNAITTIERCISAQKDTYSAAVLAQGKQHYTAPNVAKATFCDNQSAGNVSPFVRYFFAPEKTLITTQLTDIRKLLNLPASETSKDSFEGVKADFYAQSHHSAFAVKLLEILNAFHEAAPTTSSYETHLGKLAKLSTDHPARQAVTAPFVAQTRILVRQIQYPAPSGKWYHSTVTRVKHWFFRQAAPWLSAKLTTFTETVLSLGLNLLTVKHKATRYTQNPEIVGHHQIIDGILQIQDADTRIAHATKYLEQLVTMPERSDMGGFTSKQQAQAAVRELMQYFKARTHQLYPLFTDSASRRRQAYFGQQGYESFTKNCIENINEQLRESGKEQATGVYTQQLRTLESDTVRLAEYISSTLDRIDSIRNLILKHQVKRSFRDALNQRAQSDDLSGSAKAIYGAFTTSTPAQYVRDFVNKAAEQQAMPVTDRTVYYSMLLKEAEQAGNLDTQINTKIDQIGYGPSNDTTDKVSALLQATQSRLGASPSPSITHQATYAQCVQLLTAHIEVRRWLQAEPKILDIFTLNTSTVHNFIRAYTMETLALKAAACKLESANMLRDKANQALETLGITTATTNNYANAKISLVTRLISSLDIDASSDDGSDAGSPAPAAMLPRQGLMNNAPLESRPASSPRNDAMMLSSSASLQATATADPSALAAQATALLASLQANHAPDAAATIMPVHRS